MIGTWRSLAPEVRPSKNPDGTLKPLYLTRSFRYARDDRFELTITNFADPFGTVAIATIEIASPRVHGFATPAGIAAAYELEPLGGLASSLL
jgi:hypothetical protein